MYSTVLDLFRFPRPHSQPLNNFEHNDQISRIIVRNKNTAFTSRVTFLSIPYHIGRQAGLVLLFPPRILGESDGPIKNLLPISITQREHPPHLSEFGLTQGAPIPALRALLQRQTQQILSRPGVLQEHRQLRPIFPHIAHNTTPSQQHHTPTRPRNKTATNPTVHHAPIQPHRPPRQEESARKNATHNVTRDQAPPTRPFRLLLRRFHTGAMS